MKKIWVLLVISLLLASYRIAFARSIIPSDIKTPNGYKIEVAVDNLSAPTMVDFDEEGRMLIAESGYDGSGSPEVVRIERDGRKIILTKEGVFGNEVPITSVAFYQGKIYVVHAGTVSIVQSGGTLKNIVTGLPGQGDHQANSLVFKDGKMYLSIGTVTNSAVVGPDNAVFGWLKKPENSGLHDIPCKDITLTDKATFESKNISGTNLPEGKTSAYSAYGTSVDPGKKIPGNTKCNGAILQSNPDGSDLSVYAWGFRNPYGLQIGPDGALYVTMHGFDARGSRPIENAWDCFYKVQQGAWYGWPDFACDTPVTNTRFKPTDKQQPQFIIANHPTQNPPKPIAKFPPHAATNGFAFAQNGWGKSTDVFIALFGDFTPATGTVSKPHGVKIVRVDTTNGKVSDFIVNKQPGQASKYSAGGIEHPSDVTFGPDGAMYIADWGIANVSVEGLKLEKQSGVVWKVTKTNRTGLGTNKSTGPSLFRNILLTFALALAAWLISMGRGVKYSFGEGVIKGIFSGLIMGVFTMFVASPILKLPWYAPPRVLSTLVLGQTGIANILHFELFSFLVGVIALLVLTGFAGGIFTIILRTKNVLRILISGIFYGLTFWALLQYFLLPVMQPLITEKGFPPEWYALSFAFFGLVLGFLLSKKIFKERK